MSIRLQTAKDALDDGFLKDIADVGLDTFLVWAKFLTNYAYKKLVKIDPEKFMVELTYTGVVTGAQNLPADFMNIRTRGAGIYPVSSGSTITDYPLQLTGPGSFLSGYYFKGTTIYFTNIGAGQTYVLRYIPKPPVFDSLSDYFTTDTLTGGKPIFEDEDLEYVVRALHVLYMQWAEDPNKEAMADQRFARVLNDFFNDYSRGPIVGSLPNYNSMY